MFNRAHASNKTLLIYANKAAAKARALSAVMPPDFYDQSLLSAPIELQDFAPLNITPPALGYAAVKFGSTQTKGTIAHWLE